MALSVTGAFHLFVCSLKLVFNQRTAQGVESSLLQEETLAWVQGVSTTTMVPAPALHMHAAYTHCQRVFGCWGSSLHSLQLDPFELRRPIPTLKGKDGKWAKGMEPSCAFKRVGSSAQHVPMLPP